MSPTSPVTCAYGLTPTSGGQFGGILWDNSSNASDIIKLLFFGTFPEDVLTVLLKPNSCDGLGSRLGDTPWVQPTPPESKSWIKVSFGVRITNFSILVVFFTVFPLFESSLGRGQDPPPPMICAHSLTPISGDNLRRHFVATRTMLAILLSFYFFGTFPKDVLQFLYENMHVQG